jgi:hypothetical protein
LDAGLTALLCERITVAKYKEDAMAQDGAVLILLRIFYGTSGKHGEGVGVELHACLTLQ